MLSLQINVKSLLAYYILSVKNIYICLVLIIYIINFLKIIIMKKNDLKSSSHSYVLHLHHLKDWTLMPIISMVDTDFVNRIPSCYTIVNNNDLQNSFDVVADIVLNDLFEIGSFSYHDLTRSILINFPASYSAYSYRALLREHELVIYITPLYSDEV